MSSPTNIPQHVWDRLTATVSQSPYPLLFATISGAHLYGFPSPDSDFDLRGVHVLPTREVLGLMPTRETIEFSSNDDGLELDLVTHDAAKFFRLLLKNNGYVLEQLYSPLVLHTSDAHAELMRIAQGCITRNHAHHYLGFARTQWHLFEKEQRVKPLLYLYRVLLTGIHLMRTGVVEANLVHLNAVYKLPQIEDLLVRKLRGSEKCTLVDADAPFHEREYGRLTALLESESASSVLPDHPTSRAALSDLLVVLRVRQL